MKPTQEELLKKIISKAVKNGFEQFHGYYFGNMKIKASYKGEYTLFRRWEDGKEGERFVLEEIIFSHNFCKAYFGEEKEKLIYKYPQDAFNGMCQGCLKEISIGHECTQESDFNWKIHIQELALTPENERLNYLAKFLDD